MFFDLKLSGAQRLLGVGVFRCDVWPVAVLYSIKGTSKGGAIRSRLWCLESETLVPTQVNDHAPGPCSLYPYKLDW